MFAEAVGEQAIAADAHEAFWQYMQKKAAEEVHGIEGHNALLAAVCIIAPEKADALAVEGGDAVVADGRASHRKAPSGALCIGVSVQRAAADCIGQVCAVEVWVFCAGQVCAAEVCVGDVCAAEVCAVKVCAFEVCAGQVCASSRKHSPRPITPRRSAWRQETGVGRYPPLNMSYGRLPDRIRKCLLPYN